MLKIPETIGEIQQLITNAVQEDTHLDYKASPAIGANKKKEIAKDVSSFANSDGGMLIYGVSEQDNLPVGIDGGVDHNSYTREWLEQVISSNVSPRIDDIRIVPIPVSADRSLYVVYIPKSFRAPHQASDNKYYKRFNFCSEPMEDYEINDVRNRRQVVSPLINIDVEIRRRTQIYIVVKNIGELTASDVRFQFSKPLQWRHHNEMPTLFKRGTRWIPPGRSFRFFYNSYIAICAPGSELSSDFDIEVTYFHPGTGGEYSDVFYIDLMDYRDSSPVESEIYELGITLDKGLQGFTQQVTKLNDNIRQLLRIAGATGLNLSVSTVRNLRHIIHQEEVIEKLDPSTCSEHGFKEVLNISDDLAYKLWTHYNCIGTGKSLKQIEGMTEAIEAEIEKYFISSGLEMPDKNPET